MPPGVPRRSSSTTARATAPPRSRARYGALVVDEPARGFGAACWAGLRAATAEVVCFMDCDASLDPRELPRVSAPRARRRRRPRARRARRRAAAPGRRTPGPPTACWRRELRRRSGVAAHATSGRCAPRGASALLELGIADRRFGWPLEMVLRAAAAGWRIDEVAVRYRPRVGRSKVTGTRARDRARGARHGAGRSHERRSGRARQGPAARAQQDAAVPAVHAGARPRALARAALARHARRGRWRRRPPGASLVLDGGRRPLAAARLRGRRRSAAADSTSAWPHAFADVGGPALLVGMDTPQVTPGDLARGLERLAAPGIDAVLGPATDGGYWAIGLRERAAAPPSWASR